jgi:Bromodomain
MLGSEVIILHVGTGTSQRSFQVHKFLLYSNSPLWADYISSLDNPSQPLSDLDFIEEDPSIFAFLIEWLYRGSIPSLPSPSAQPQKTAITLAPKNQLLKFLTKTAKTQLGEPFKAPVSEIWPEYAEHYAQQIEFPIDLSTIISKLEANKYATLEELKSEFNLLYNNSVLFNGLNNSVTKKAIKLRAKVNEKIEEIESADKVPSRQISNNGDGEEEDKTSRELRHALQKLICLSERYRFDALSAVCMDVLIEVYKAHRLYPSSETIAYVYANTVAGSKLRLYMARGLAHMILSKAPVEGKLLSVKTYWIWEVMKENAELGTEVLLELRGKNGVPFSEAEDAASCEYHWHEEVETCPLEWHGVDGLVKMERM